MRQLWEKILSYMRVAAVIGIVIAIIWALINSGGVEIWLLVGIAICIIPALIDRIIKERREK